VRILENSLNDFVALGVVSAFAAGSVSEELLGDVYGSASYRGCHLSSRIWYGVPVDKELEQEFNMESNNLLSAVVYFEKNILYFSKNDKLVPCYITGLPKEIYFGVCIIFFF
jgi:hypothetical protein